MFNKTVDSFFSNQKYLVSENKSSIYVSTAFYKIEGSKPETDVDFQARFDLPRTTEKLKIVVEREQNEIKKALTDESVTRNIRRGPITSKYTSVSEKNYTAGADFLLPKLLDLKSMVKIGLRIDVPINPFLKLNLQKNIKTKIVDIDLMQTFLLYRQAGFQEISQLGFNRKINKDFHLEQLNSLVWTDEKDLFELRHSLTLYQNLGEEKGISYALGANAKLSPVYYYESYDASVSYRQLIYSRWLYGTLTLGSQFAKANHFDDEKFVQLKLDAFFR